MKKTPTNQEIQNFRPKCLQPVRTNVTSGAVPFRSQPEHPWLCYSAGEFACIHTSITATGFVLPCCWLDRPDGSENLLEDEKIKPFFDKELHIDNNKTIDDIVNSDMWQNFMSDLINKPEESSPFCFKVCSSEGNIHRRQEKWL